MIESRTVSRDLRADPERPPGSGMVQGTVSLHGVPRGTDLDCQVIACPADEEFGTMCPRLEIVEARHDGSYSLALAPGDWKIGAAYVQQGSVREIGRPRTATVAVDETIVRDLSVDYRPTGTVQGAVSVEGLPPGRVVARVFAAACPADEPFDESCEQFTADLAGDDGGYALLLPPGDWNLAAIYFDVPKGTVGPTTLVTVVAGETLTQDVAVEYRIPPGVGFVQGQVTVHDAPADMVYRYAMACPVGKPFGSECQGLVFTEAHADGAYTLPLPPGEWNVGAGYTDDDPRAVPGPPHSVTVAEGHTIDLALAMTYGSKPEKASEVEPATPAEPRSDRRDLLFVWACWAISVVSTFVVVLRNARNIPTQEDWHLVPAFTGHQDDLIQWIWSPNNEHRVPVPKLVYLGILKLWPDFRVGMVFNMVVVAAIAAGFVIALRQIRGRTRWTDAFFPVAFLHLGHWENFGWSWELQFVVATAFACAVLIIVVTKRGMWTTRRALLLGACLIGIPLSGGTALPFAPLVALGLIPELRFARERARAVLIGSIGLTLAVFAVSIVGLERPDWVRPSPGSWESLQTGAKFLALGVGPAAGAWWFVTAAAVGAVLASAGYILYRARSQGTWVLLAFIGAAVALGGLLGHGRAGVVQFYGLPDRYAIIAVPGLCCAYIAYERYGSALVRRLGPAVLCIGIIGLLPLNIAFGFQYRDWYHQRVDTFAADLKAGMSIDQLSYYRPIAADPEEMWLSMTYLQEAGIGVFSRLQRYDSPSPTSKRIDGLDDGASGWTTVGGSASQFQLEVTEGEQVLRWDYDARPGTAAVVGRAFDRPQDWRGMGALELVVRGEGTGRRIRIRLALTDKEGTLDRYDSFFLDDVTGRRTIVIPWNGFGHADVRGTFDWEGPMPLDRVEAVVFVATEPGEGSLVIERLALRPGHGQIGWPFHPAVDRRSLWPWR